MLPANGPATGAGRTRAPRHASTSTAADSSRAPRSSPRAPARRRRSGAAARGSQRQHWRRESALLSRHQLDQLSRRNQRRTVDAARRQRHGVASGPVAASAGVHRGATAQQPGSDTSQLRRSGRAVREGGAQRLPRSRQRTHHSTEARGHLHGAADRCGLAAQRRRPVARPLQQRACQLYRDPDGRPGSVCAPTAARTDGGLRIARPRGTVSRAWRRLAAMKRKKYEDELRKLQARLCILQEWVKAKGLRVVVVFEGRDAAGKGGTIKAITERVSPRVFRVVALPAPSDREKSQMYLQRYFPHFPAAGEITIFDRSWYNRAGVEHVMGFCSEKQYRRFLALCPTFERNMVETGLLLIKFWLEVDNKEQERRFAARIKDPLRQWKLSAMDLPSRAKC